MKGATTALAGLAPASVGAQRQLDGPPINGVARACTCLGATNGCGACSLTRPTHARCLRSERRHAAQLELSVAMMTPSASPPAVVYKQELAHRPSYLPCLSAFFDQEGETSAAKRPIARGPARARRCHVKWRRTDARASRGRHAQRGAVLSHEQRRGVQGRRAGSPARRRWQPV